MSDQLNAESTPRQHEQLRRYTSYTLVHSSTADIRMIMMAKWYSGETFGPKASSLCLTGEK